MKLASIEFIRGLAVSLVVVYHLYAVQDRYLEVNHLPGLFQLGGSGVDMFFVISGVVMYKTLYCRPNAHNIWSFLSARVTRIYPPYWVITIVIYFIAWLDPTLVNSSYDQQPSLLKSLLLLPDVTNPWLNVGWSLVFEIWFYLLLGVLLVFPQKVVCIILLIYACFLLFYDNLHQLSPFIILISDPLILEFISGFALGLMYFRVKNHNKKFILISFILIPLTFLAVFAAIEISISDNSIERIILFGLPAVSIVAFGLYFDDFFSQNLIFKPMIYIGKISYSVYLTHVLALNAFLFGSFRILKLEISPIVANIACFLFVIIFGSIYYIVIERPSTRAMVKFLSKS